MTFFNSVFVNFVTIFSPKWKIFFESILPNFFFLFIFYSSFTEDSNFEPEGWVVSSESCAFQSIGAKFVREVLPGEIVQITNQGIKTLAIVPRPKKDPPAFCIFEYVYFARPDSLLQGESFFLFFKV